MTRNSKPSGTGGRRRSVRLSLIAALATTALTAALAVAGCAGGGDSKPKAASPGATFPVTVGQVKLEQQPKRIVSLSPTLTEMLFAIGAGGQVTAVDDQSNYPPEAPKTDLSGFKPNAEAIAGKNPDLVVLSGDTNKIVDQLASLKIPTYLAPAAKTLDDSYAQLNDLGRLTGHGAAASATVQQMRDEITKATKDVKPRTRKLTYYHELTPEGYSVTSKTFIGSVYSMFGLTSIADAADTTGSGYPQLSSEAVIKANPDLIFLADGRCCQQSPATIKARPGFAGVAAVANDHIATLDEDIASRWGPRVVDLIRAVGAVVEKVPAQ